MLLPMRPARPDSSQSEIGCSAVKSTSQAPARSISSRTICSTLCSTRMPSGE